MPLRHVSHMLHAAIHSPDWRGQWRTRGRTWRVLSRLGLTGLHAAPIHRAWLDVRRMKMRLPNLPTALVGRKLVQISDLHVSPVVWGGYMRHQLRHVAALRPDVLVVTGDLITGGYRYADIAAGLLGEITPRPPLGIICTLGNHDYGSPGVHRTREGERRARHIEGALARQGIRLLRNEAVSLGAAHAVSGRDEHGNSTVSTNGLTLVGLDDLASGRLDAARAFRGVTGPAVCLNHDPRNAPELLGFPWEWMLSGHTHGRQLAESRIGRRFNGHRRRTYVRGLYDLAPGRTLYVNRGLSYGQRWHAWCKPEITVFSLDTEAAS